MVCLITTILHHFLFETTNQNILTLNIYDKNVNRYLKQIVQIDINKSTYIIKTKSVFIIEFIWNMKIYQSTRFLEEKIW
jgi:hypothetical protein